MNDAIVISKKIESRTAKRLVTHTQKYTVCINLLSEPKVC